MDVKVKGQPIELDGITYVLPPLPLARMADVKLLMNGGDPFKDPEYVLTLIRALHWSLIRNYPAMTIEVVQEALDMVNYTQVMRAFQLTNGFVNPTEQSGEAAAAQ